MTKATRDRTSFGLAVIGSVLLLVGTLLFYAREQVVASDPFADKAEDALEDARVRNVVSREIVVNLVEGGSADLVAARPVVESVVETVIDTEGFRKLFRRAALEANRLFFDRGKENLVFDLADASEIVRFGLKNVSPELAKEVPKDLDVTLADLRNRDFAQSTLAAADEIRFLGLLIPLLAALVLVGAVAVSADRRVGVLRVAIGMAAAGALLVVAMLILREVTLNGVYGDDELTDEEVRGAVAGLLDAFFGKLFSWSLLLAFVGIVVSGAAAALDPDELRSPSQRLRERFARAASDHVGTRRPRPGRDRRRVPDRVRAGSGPRSDRAAGRRLPRLLGRQRAAGDAGGRRRRQGRRRGAPQAQPAGGHRHGRRPWSPRSGSCWR